MNFFDQLTNTGSITYGYEGRGNLTKITNGSNITNYTYNAADQLTNVTATGVNATYVYNADGKRVKQTLGSTVTNYLWDEASPYGDVVYEYNNSGSALASYVLGGTGLISQTRGTTTNYFLQDGQGSTRGLTSSTGAITDTYSYSAFGELQNQTGTTTNNYLYTGQQFDSLTGLYDLRARYYNPALGRFLSKDTYPVNFGNPVEFNRYVYTANSPINAMDPTGNFAEMVGAYRPAAENTGRVGLIGILTRGLYARTVITFVLIAAPTFAVVGELIGLEDIGKELQDVDIKSLERIMQEAQWREWLRLRTIPTPSPEPSEEPAPRQVGTQIPPIVTTPTQPPRKVRVRHYSQQIDYIRSIMLIKSRDGLAIWVEYPITTPYEEQAIQKTTSSFMIPLNGRGGFVEFYVDLNKWYMEPDPNLPGVKGATMIWLGGPGNLTYIQVGFPLGEPDVDPEFFDWQGNPK